MFGKYADNRVHQHFVHTYSRVPYLDTEIFNIETNSLRQSRRANNRALMATQGIQRTKEKSEKLISSMKDSRLKKDKEAQDFMLNLRQSQNACLAKEKQTWTDYEKQRGQNQINYVKDQQYLDSILKSNSTRAESRLTSVRRWH